MINYKLAYKRVESNKWPLAAISTFETLNGTVFAKISSAKQAVRKANKSLRKKGLGLGCYKLKIISEKGE